MIALAKKIQLLDSPDPHLLYEHSDNKVIVFERANLLFAFNFHPDQSYSDYRFEAPPGKYRMILNSDAAQYNGHKRLVPKQEHTTLKEKVDHGSKNYLSLYLPTRTAVVLQRLI
jgi:1,4-alpha-glucan branching enzyme